MKNSESENFWHNVNEQTADEIGLSASPCSCPDSRGETGLNEALYPIEFEKNVDFLVKKTGRQRDVIVNSLITICRNLNKDSKGGLLQDSLFKILSLENPKGLEELRLMPTENLNHRKLKQQHQDHL